VSNIVAIILGAGQSNRMQGIDKILHEIKKQPVILFSLKKFLSLQKINKIIIVSNINNKSKIQSIVEKNIESNQIKKIQLINGGKRRQDSVKKAIDIAPDATQFIIHDAARPFVSKELIQNVINKLKTYDAVIPTIPISDALKKIDNNKIIQNVDRKQYALAQTPQGFRSQILREAFQKIKKDDYPDCASMILENDTIIHSIAGEISNKKITFREDLDEK
jgi:2-C-methyl-D-erythritol 4-phosphate cytidylyltransferase